MRRNSPQSEIKLSHGQKGPKPSAPKEIIIPIGPSIAYVPLSQGEWSLVDAEDALGLQAYHWSVWRNGNVSYAIGSLPSIRSQVYMHRLLLSSPRGKQVDHANRRGLDNRRINLRIATSSQNNANRPAMENASGHRGIYPSGKKWRARIKFNKKLHHLGTFDSFDVARDVYIAKSIELFGAFSIFKLN